jgi:hypothetical protein
MQKQTRVPTNPATMPQWIIDNAAEEARIKLVRAVANLQLEAAHFVNTGGKGAQFLLDAMDKVSAILK